jgi:hypothetical protein
MQSLKDFVDLTKAFNCVRQRTLLTTLSYYGLNGNASLCLNHVLLMGDPEL